VIDVIDAPRVIVGNKREVPPGLPISEWWDRVLALEEREDLSALPWYDNRMEFLSPDELRRIRAKALVWREETGEWPPEIAWWWEIRNARKRGDLPHGATIATVRVIDGVTHCGYCGARWSPPAPDRCPLCDSLFLIEEAVHV